MFRVLLLIVPIILVTATAEAQGNLSELFSIIRKEGPAPSESGRIRRFEVLEPYATGKKSLDGEWQAINDALSDADPFVRDQSCAVLATIVYVNMARPIRLPDTTRDIVIQRFSEPKPNLRENAVRIIALMAGGVPPVLAPQLLKMAQTEIASSVRGVAIAALASIPTPSPEITEFWAQSLNNVSDKGLRGMVLNAFRLYAPTDPKIISLVIDALRDTDRFVRQEAIASVLKIGKPAAAALPMLLEIRDAPGTDEVLRSNADAAIRVLSGSR